MFKQKSLQIFRFRITTTIRSIFRKKQSNKKSVFYPLAVNTCRSCGFKQLTHVIDPKILYQQDYPYESVLTKSGLNHFYEFAFSVKKRFNLNSEDLVIDIGSNVGVLLNFFKSLGTKY